MQDDFCMTPVMDAALSDFLASAFTTTAAPQPDSAPRDDDTVAGIVERLVHKPMPAAVDGVVKAVCEQTFSDAPPSPNAVVGAGKVETWGAGLKGPCTMMLAVNEDEPVAKIAAGESYGTVVAMDPCTITRDMLSPLDEVMLSLIHI